MAEVIDNILVVKVGTNTLSNAFEDGAEELDQDSFDRIGLQINQLSDEGLNPVIVSSAGIVGGMEKEGLKGRPDKDDEDQIPELQRLFSIGWRFVLDAWDRAMPDKTIGEVLLTQSELGLAPERREALRLTHNLLQHGDIPVANENDAITHKEITFGDNDILAAKFAVAIARSALFGSNVRLVILSDVDGIYEDPSKPDTVIPAITDLEQYGHVAGRATSKTSKGGARSKFEAAKIALEGGLEMWVANGRTEDAIRRTLGGEIGTHFKNRT